MIFYMTDLGAFLLNEEKIERNIADSDVIWDNVDSKPALDSSKVETCNN